MRDSRLQQFRAQKEEFGLFPTHLPIWHSFSSFLFKIDFQRPNMLIPVLIPLSCVFQSINVEFCMLVYEDTEI